MSRVNPCPPSLTTNTILHLNDLHQTTLFISQLVVTSWLWNLRWNIGWNGYHLMVNQTKIIRTTVNLIEAHLSSGIRLSTPANWNLTRLLVYQLDVLFCTGKGCLLISLIFISLINFSIGKYHCYGFTYCHTITPNSFNNWLLVCWLTSVRDMIAVLRLRYNYIASRWLSNYCAQKLTITEPLLCCLKSSIH